MKIRQMNSDSGERWATVDLSYDEIKNISNLFRRLIILSTKYDEQIDINECKVLHSRFKLLFDMVKHGYIMRETVCEHYDLIDAKDESEEVIEL